jgi:excisionase family DNA binding protein
MSKAALSIDEFCDSHGVGKTLAYQEINSGRLHAIKIGRRTLIPAEAAAQWLASLPALIPQQATD